MVISDRFTQDNRTGVTCEAENFHCSKASDYTLQKTGHVVPLLFTDLVNSFDFYCYGVESILWTKFIFDKYIWMGFNVIALRFGRHVIPGCALIIYMYFK